MYTPEQLREKVFKGGLGYEKKDVEQFLNELASDYEQLLQENADLKKKVKDQSDSIGYYKTIEKTLQKALILAEKTAQDTKATAAREAEAIEAEARTNAGMIRAEALKRLELLENKTLNMIRQYDFFKIQFENMLHAQLDLINSSSFQINTQDFLYYNVKTAGDDSKIAESSPDDILAYVNDSDAFGEDSISEAAISKASTGDETADCRPDNDGFEFIDPEDEL